MRFTDTDAASSCILWILLASRPYIVLIKQLPELADIIVQFEHFYLAPFLNPFWRHSFQIELYNWWWMCTENNTNTTASAWIGLRENVGRINITTVYSSSKCLSPCWWLFSKRFATKGVSIVTAPTTKHFPSWMTRQDSSCFLLILNLDRGAPDWLNLMRVKRNDNSIYPSHFFISKPVLASKKCPIIPILWYDY